MSERKKVAVVILGWNGKKYLEQFMPSVVKYTTHPAYEIIVADNCSTDDSVAFMKQHYPQVRLILNKRNGGYAGGYNDALKEVNAEYYVLLNQDVEVTEGWVDAVIAEMDKDLNIAAAQPKLRDYNRREYFEYAGAAGGYVDRFGFAFCRGRVFDTIEKDEGQHDTVTDVFWATGACMFVRAEAYWKAGGLDEDFFAHQEEIDLCWRMLNLGYRNIAVPQSVVYHVGGGSLEYKNPRKAYLNYRNNLYMMFKNLPTGQLFWKMPARMFLDAISALVAVAKEKNFKTLWAIEKAHFSFFAAIPSLLKKRKKIQHYKDHALFPKSVVWQYFVGGKKTFDEL